MVIRSTGMRSSHSEPARSSSSISTEALRHGAYLCLSVPPDVHPALARLPVPALVERLGLRRTYKHPVEPAPHGAYDFITYFECADADVPTFHAVCAALRDVTS